MSYVRPLLLASLLLQAGCVPSVSLSPEDKSRIRTISVSQADIEVPPEVYYHGPGQAMLGTLGVVGAVAGQAAADEPKARLQEIISRENISVAAMLEAALKKKFGESNTFKVVENNADAKVRVKVTRYGLRISEGFATTVKPWLSARVALIDASGKVVSENLYMPEIMSAGDFAEVYPLTEFIAKPALLRSGLERAAEIIAEKTLDGLK